MRRLKPMIYSRPVRWKRKTAFFTLLGWGVLGLFSGTNFLLAEEQGAPNAIFAGPVAEYEQVPPVSSTPPDATGVLRWVWVEERMNVARQKAPVRVPVFLAAGECRNPEELVLMRWPSREIVAVQADDVRRGADGGVARLHLWFTTDLRAGEKQRLALVLRGTTQGAPEKSVETRIMGERLQIHAAGSAAMFYTETGRRGPLAALQLQEGPLLEFAEGAGPDVTWSDPTISENGTTGSGNGLAWGTGPVFAKVSFRHQEKNGSVLTQVFRIFSDGSVNVIQTVNPSEATNGLSLSTQDFLRGNLTATDALTVQPQLAGIVDSLRDVHRGFAVDALLQGGRSRGWLVVPGSVGGVAGRLSIDHDRQFRLQAPGGLTRGAGDARVGTVRAFWAEVTFVPARREGEGLERAVELTAGQPLVAVVERPGVSLAMAVARLQDNVKEMKPVGWVNESVVRSLQGKTDPFPKRRWAMESEPDFWVKGAQQAAAKVMGNIPRPLKEEEKGRAAGSLDPYHITYGLTALVDWLLRDDLPVPARDSLRAQLEAVRRQMGRVDEQGWPYLDVFFRTQNMQMGPPLLTLADSGANPALRQYYRDQLSAPSLNAVMLRGLRPYQGSPQLKPAESDTLYQSVVDFMLRATELSLNESLGLQPVAFGRYLDAIDVNADLYHPAHPRTEDEGGRFARANFFRTQSHLHRWLAWGPAPFIALLQTPIKEGESFPGATEAWQFANVLAGHWKNWPDQSWLYLASVLPRKAGAYAPFPRPAAVKISSVQRQADGNHFSWEKQADAVAYRVYRLRRGLPPAWLNSPYKNAAQNDDRTERVDEEGKIGDEYVIHAVDKSGRESAW